MRSNHMCGGQVRPPRHRCKEGNGVFYSSMIGLETRETSGEDGHQSPAALLQGVLSRRPLKWRWTFVPEQGGPNDSVHSGGEINVVRGVFYLWYGEGSGQSEDSTS